MASIGQVRGMLLEEIVLNLLSKVGYRTVTAGEEGTHLGPAGLMLRGRGTWHQIDGLAALDHGPAFTYPIRLLVEAKCYSRYAVDISTIRNCVGVLRDVSENYFVQRDPVADDEVALPRYNFLSAVFSTSGYTDEAQRFALAHQIFLIQYKNIPALAKIITLLLSVNEREFPSWRQGFGPDNSGPTPEALGQLRRVFRRALTEQVEPFLVIGLLRGAGIEKLLTLARLTTEIQGSYYGMIQGQYPVHLLSPAPIPPDLFVGADEVRCRIYGSRPETWFIEPSWMNQNEPGYFRLEFGLPDQVARLVRRVWGNPELVANAKREYFSFIALSGVIGGVRRQVRLTLDDHWLDTYLEQGRRGRY
jgi:hypothetical protein